MKKLGKLKLNELDKSLMVLDPEHVNRLKGGWWPYNQDNPYCLPEVVVCADRYYEPFNLWGPGSVFGVDNYCFNPNSVDRYWNSWGSSYSTCSYNPPSGTGGGGYIGCTYMPPTNTSSNGLNFIASWEKGPNGGAALIPYDDNGSAPGGFMTIGYGHKIQPGEDFSSGITEAQALVLLNNDIQTAVNNVINSVTVSLTQSQFDALVSYVFNTGSLQNSPQLLQNLNNSNYAAAAAEMDINTSNSVYMQGLENRRIDERNMFLYGIYNYH